MKLTPFAKAFITIVILAVVGYVVYVKRATLIPAAGLKTSIVPSKVDLPNAPEGAGSGVAFRLPGEAPGCTDQPEVRFNVWAWNSQMGLMAATGGQQSTEGSLMCA